MYPFAHPLLQTFEPKFVIGQEIVSIVYCNSKTLSLKARRNHSQGRSKWALKWASLVCQMLVSQLLLML